MADQKILREYLIALGIKTDPAVKKLDKDLSGIDKALTKTAKGLLGFGAATVAAVTQFAAGMEKLYYSSKLSQTSVASLQSAAFAGSKIGLQAEQVTGSIQRMAGLLRGNPGLKAFLESFGVKVDENNMAKTFNDMVKTFSKLPHFIGQQFAEEFGLDPDTFFLMKTQLDDFNQAQRENVDLMKQMGYDADAAAKVSKEYLNDWRDINNMLKMVSATAMSAMLPAFKEVSGVTKEVLKDWAAIFEKMDKRNKRGESGIGGFFSDLSAGLFGVKPGVVLASGAGGKLPKTTAEALARFNAAKNGPSIDPGYLANNAASSTSFAALEARYGLPRGLLDSMWLQESGRGKHMLSKAGAKGHFGFMDATAKEWGVTDPNDLTQSSTGAAKYMQFLLSRYNGDLDKALAAYNWGLGNVDKYGLGSNPSETQAYRRDVQSRLAFAQGNTTILIDAKGMSINELAQAVGERLERRDGDLIRNLDTAFNQ